MHPHLLLKRGRRLNNITARNDTTCILNFVSPFTDEHTTLYNLANMAVMAIIFVSRI